jgi:hypothetical protein
MRVRPTTTDTHGVAFLDVVGLASMLPSRTTRASFTPERRTCPGPGDLLGASFRPRLASSVFHHRRDESAIPCSAANFAADCPLPSHAVTNSAHSAALILVPMRVSMAPSSPSRKNGPHAGRTYFRLADTPAIFRDLDAWIRHRLRALQLKHWKNESTVYRELRARGLSERKADKVARNTKSWWRNSGLEISIALPVSHFDKLGVPRLAV